MPFGFIGVNSNKKNWSQNTVHFRIATYKVLHERSNKTASFAEHMKFFKKYHFNIYTFSQNWEIKAREVE